MKILVINAGSSSLKYQLIDMENESLLAKGLCERIGIDGRLTHKPQNGKPVYEADVPFPTHKEAIEAVLEKLTSKEYGVVETMAEIGAVGHRIVNGGEWLTEPVLVNEQVLADLEKCRDIAPRAKPPSKSASRSGLCTTPPTSWASRRARRRCPACRRSPCSTPPSACP